MYQLKVHTLLRIQKAFWIVFQRSNHFMKIIFRNLSEELAEALKMRAKLPSLAYRDFSNIYIWFIFRTSLSCLQRQQNLKCIKRNIEEKKAVKVENFLMNFISIIFFFQPFCMHEKSLSSFFSSFSLNRDLCWKHFTSVVRERRRREEKEKKLSSIERGREREREIISTSQARRASFNLIVILFADFFTNNGFEFINLFYSEIQSN